MGCCVSTAKKAGGVYQTNQDQIDLLKQQQFQQAKVNNNSNFPTGAEGEFNPDAYLPTDSQPTSTVINNYDITKEKTYNPLIGDASVVPSLIYQNPDFDDQNSELGRQQRDTMEPVHYNQSDPSGNNINGSASEAYGGSNSIPGSMHLLKRDSQGNIVGHNNNSNTGYINSNSDLGTGLMIKGINENSYNMQGVVATGPNSNNNVSSENHFRSAQNVQNQQVNINDPNAVSDSQVQPQKPKKRSTVLEQKLRQQYSQIRDIPFWRPKQLTMETEGRPDKNGRNKNGNHVIGLTLSRRQLNKFYKWQPVGGAKGAKNAEDITSEDPAKATDKAESGFFKRRSSESSRTDQYGFLLKKPLASRRVKQGAVGDCSFLAILNCLVDFDATFNNNFENSPSNKYL